MKVTPAHDPNDFAIGQRHNLPSINVMDTRGLINENGGPYAGLDRYAARKKILADLEEQGILVAVERPHLRVGRCDRCKTVVEPRLSTQWFLAVNKVATGDHAPHDGLTLQQRAIAAVEQESRQDRPRTTSQGLPRLDGQHARLVHQPPALVGTPHSRVALRRLRQDDRRA